jgi:predicted ATPase/DNA-binding XRE family transcriptional regulator
MSGPPPVVGNKDAANQVLWRREDPAIQGGGTRAGAPASFGAQLKTLREAAGYTQEELATMAGLSVHGVSALERGERRRPHVDTVRALSAALDLTAAARDSLTRSARTPAVNAAVDELSGVSLPLPLTSLLGREAELQTLRQWLATPAVRLVTLTGPGGAGKTRLALELARAISAEGATRVVFVPLAAIQTPALVAPAIAEALGLSDNALDAPGPDRIACGDRPTLLVLDNFEHLPEAAPLVAALLGTITSLRVLATSRAALRVRGEREHAVGPLALRVVTEAMAPADLAASPAVRLFIERVRDVQPDFRLTPANGPVVAAICQRLDALPLALELAAPWIKVLTAEGLLHWLSHGVLLSSLGPRDLPERQQTMNATVAWSYQLLAPNEQGVFRRLAALPGRFPIEAAAAVLAGRDGPRPEGHDALAAVAGLIDKSLLLRAETSVAARPLYQMLETVRAYAALELAAAGERDDAMQGLARYCASETSVAAQALLGLQQVEWLGRMRDDVESYRSALSWLIEKGCAVDASRIAWNLMFFWVIRGHATEGLRWYEQILRLGTLPPAAESRTLLGAAAMAYTQGELGRARTWATGALAIAEGDDDPGIAVQAENLCGHLEHADGNFEAARERFARSIAGFRALSIPWGVGNALSGMAGVALATGDAGEAERLLDEAAAVLGSSGPWFLLLALYVRAILAVRSADAERAIALVGESLTHTRALHDRFGFLYALVPLAAAAALKGDHAWAARILGARDAVRERTGAAAVDRSVSDLQDHVERASRARLGQERWAVAYAAGRVSSIDGLLKDIDGVFDAAPARR